MKKRLITVFIILIVVCALTFSFDVRLKTVTYNIECSKINEEIKICLLTDLHSCYYGKNQNKILKEIEAYCPDALLLGGDIFDDAIDNANARVTVQELSKRYKTYYVSGNHEWWSKEMQDLFKYLESCGVDVLRGESHSLKIGKDKIIIHGIDDPEVNIYDDKFPTWEKQLEKTGNNIEGNCFNLLLAHRPEYAGQYFKHNFDAALSGHAHGGQFGIPFIMNGFYAPGQGFFPKLAGGMYDFDGKKLIVSRGLARESTRLPRIFNRPELVFVNIAPME